MKRFLACVMLMLLSACSPLAPAPTALPAVETPQASPTGTPTQPAPTATPQPSPSPLPPTPTPIPPVPAFEHIAIIVLENKDFDTIAGSPSMPFLNQLADGNTLLTQYYTPAHPSLPNYLALIGGDTFGVTRNCEDCFQQAPNLADLIEQSGRTWKTYQESMPEACYRGSSGAYVQKHNPFVYFDSIRLNPQRCQRSVVPLQALEADLAAGDLPNFIFITPDLCHSGHDCPREDVDDWLSQWVPRLQDGMGAQSLLVITFDEATGDDASGCCGMPEPAGGRVATLLVSPLVKQSFEDPTPYSHYSLLKTIATAWNLPELGRAAAPETALIQAPFQSPLRVSAFLIGAGDIGVCGSPGDEYTARLLDRLPGDIFTAGDNSNEAGLPEQYTECYETAWGRHKARIHPSPGNHDYQTDNGAGYHAYFGAAAGTPGQGWYSYDLGPWHIIALNGNCAQVGGCGADSAQMAWLLADLSASSAQCTLAYWHQPRFSSGIHGSDETYVPFWQALYDAGAEIVVNGHDHIYERLAPMDPEGSLDPQTGIRQFIAGTGGAFYRDLGEIPAPHSERIILNTFGVLKFTLREGSYEWKFIPEPSKQETDSGAGVCH